MNFKVFFLISLCLIKNTSASLSCRPCEKTRCHKIECCESGELTLDNCRCCPKCVNVDQEPCGGLWGGAGECASGLNCFKQFECQTKKGENCIFPFNFGGKTYNACTSKYLKKGTGQWCATGVYGNGTMIKGKWGYCNSGIGKCDGPHNSMYAPYWHSNVKGICVDKKQIEDQLKANKSIVYHFDVNSSQKKKIKRCSKPGSADPGCDFKGGIKDLKQEMTKMKRELIIAINAQKSKNCRPQRYGNVGQKHKKKNHFS